MIHKNAIIIGGGPAGLCAAKHLLEANLSVLIVDRSMHLGGQLIKQTHKFFGSEKQYAKTRGFNIATKLISNIIDHPNLEIRVNTTAVGLYPDHVVTLLSGETYQKVQADVVIIATGASEKNLAFEHNDLPGIYGAGAVQTLMNVHGVLPGQRLLMVGSGNIGLIVSYQLIQAGVEVVGLVEAAPTIGGYKVHASKLKRLGVEIMVSTTLKRAIGKEAVEAAEIISLDASWNPIEGSERIILVDAICIAVGLSPMHQLISMINAKTKFVNELGGFVPIINEEHETSVPNLFVCGDASGIEEASSAIVEGYMTGLIAAARLNHYHPQYDTLLKDYKAQLEGLRSGPFGAKTRQGLNKLREQQHA